MDVKRNCWRSCTIWLATYMGCPLATQMKRKTFLSRKNSVPSKILTWHWTKPSAVCVLTTGEKTFVVVEMQYTLTAITVFTLGLVSKRWDFLSSVSKEIITWGLCSTVFNLCRITVTSTDSFIIFFWIKGERDGGYEASTEIGLLSNRHSAGQASWSLPVSHSRGISFSWI